MVWFSRKKDNNGNDDDQERLNGQDQELGNNVQFNSSPYALKEQEEDLPMDLGTLQDIFSFSFIRGRPIANFLLAIIWSIGLPILLYHILLGYVGQVLAMVIASSPPLAIVVLRIFKEKTVDILGIVAGLSFLISGIISIAEPDEKTSAICESIIPLLVGVFCLGSLIPLRIGKFESRPLIFQVANQVMPRQEEDNSLNEYDHRRQQLQHCPSTKRQKLDYLYTHMTRFRQDMRVMTACWGMTLVVTFIVKVVVVLTNADTGYAETVGYIVFGLATGLMVVFTWFYTKIVKRHVTDSMKEGLCNATWGVRSMGNTFGQVVGGGG